MEKQKLQKMKILEATDEMVQAAEKDIPIINNLPYEKMTYPVGLFMLAEEEENILKIGFFFTEILTAGGRRPSYTLFIDKEKDYFIGYDYRLKKWTNKMLDKIELPKGVKGDHAWCDLNSRSQIWETIVVQLSRQKSKLFIILRVESSLIKINF